MYKMKIKLLGYTLEIKKTAPKDEAWEKYVKHVREQWDKGNFVTFVQWTEEEALEQYHKLANPHLYIHRD